MTDEEKLLLYAEEYVADKSLADKYKKSAEVNNTEIKRLMVALGKTEVVLDDGTCVVYSVSKTDEVDEVKLLKVLKEFAPETRCIKTKEYIDSEILANEIYRGELNDDALCAMDDCRSVKETPKLTIKKPKKGKKK